MLKKAKLKKVLVTDVTSLRRNKNAAFRKSALFLCSIYTNWWKRAGKAHFYNVFPRGELESFENLGSNSLP